MTSADYFRFIYQLYLNFYLIVLYLYLIHDCYVSFFFFFLFFFRDKKKRTRVWQSLSHAPWYSWVSPWVPQARTGAWKLRTHTHPRLYWFLRLPEIAIAVLVRTRTWDVMKSQQSPTSCTTPTGGNSNTHLITLSLNSNTLRELNIMTIKLSNKKKNAFIPISLETKRETIVPLFVMYVSKILL